MGIGFVTANIAKEVFKPFLHLDDIDEMGEDDFDDEDEDEEDDEE